MKRNAICIVLITLVTFGSQLSAQHHERAQRAGNERGRIVQELNLSDEQEETMQAIHDEFQIEMEQVRSNPELSSDIKRAQLKELRDDKRMRIQEILTEDQLMQLKQHKPFGPGRFHKNMGNSNANFALILEKRKEFELLLTDDERRIIRDVRDEFVTHRDKVRNDRPCLKKEKGNMPEKENRWACMNQLEPIISNHKDELEAIAEEIEQYVMDSPKKRRNGRRKHESRRGPEDNLWKEKHFLLMDPNGKQDLEPAGYIENDRIRLYPNPVKDILNIEFVATETGSIDVELLDKSGSVIKRIDGFSGEKGPHTNTLDVGNLRSGELYYIRVSSNDTSWVEKFIKL